MGIPSFTPGLLTLPIGISIYHSIDFRCHYCYVCTADRNGETFRLRGLFNLSGGVKLHYCGMLINSGGGAILPFCHLCLYQKSDTFVLVKDNAWLRYALLVYTLCISCYIVVFLYIVLEFYMLTAALTHAV